MAKIFGMYVKGLIKYRQKDVGDVYQGSLFLDNQRLGFVNTGLHGEDLWYADWDEDIFHGLNELLRKSGKSVKVAPNTFEAYNISYLFIEWIELSQLEKYYNRQVKKYGPGTAFGVKDNIYFQAWGMMPKKDDLFPVDSLHKIYEIKDDFPESDFIYFHSLDDFDMGKHISLSALYP